MVLTSRNLKKNIPRVAEIPFDSDRKCMTTFHKQSAVSSQQSAKKIEYVSFTKGAIDVLIDKSDNILTADGLKEIDREEILRVSDRMAADGLRVLCIAMRKWDSHA